MSLFMFISGAMATAACAYLIPISIGNENIEAAVAWGVATASTLTLTLGHLSIILKGTT